MKKTFFTLFVVVSIFLLTFPTAQGAPDPPQISAQAAILVDASTGKILYEKNADKKMEPASITKIMTAVLAIENADLSDIVVSGLNPTLAEGSRIYLENGEKLTLEQMLYALLLNSGNDAAVAIAEHVAPDVESFVTMMNEKAIELGASNTTFMNPSGLPNENHLTTARDLAVITRYAMGLPEFRRIVATKTFKIPWEGSEWDRQLQNLNRLLWDYDGADGVKTGYTRSAGQTLVASATRGGWRLISVVLKDESRFSLWGDATDLLDYGYNNFQKYDVISEDKYITCQKVKYGDDINLVTASAFITVLPKGSEIRHKLVLSKQNLAPIKKGQTLGKMEFYCKDNKIGSIDLIAQHDVGRKIYTFWWFNLLFLAAILYIPFRILIGIRRYKRMRRQIKHITYLHRYK